MTEIDHTQMKLGKAAAVHDKRTLRLFNYIDESKLPLIPDACDYTNDVSDWGLMLNDQLGDCTIAAPGHMQMLWTSEAGKLVVPGDGAILAAYEEACGYNPKDPRSDQGGVMINVMNYWRDKGIAGNKIEGYGYLNPKNQQHIKTGIFLFGAVNVGVQLPLSAQGQTPWHITDGADAEAGSWGGHDIPLVAYDEDGLICITWGQKQKMTWEWFFKYCDEAYGVLDDQWFGASSLAPNHFDIAQLQADLKALG